MVNEMNILEKPATLYKYASVESAKKILATNSLMFSQPGSFNDPFDCDISLLKFDMSECGPEVKADISALKKLYPKHNLSEEFLTRAYEGSQQNKISKASVTCFSLINNSIEMWGHYGDKNYGVCLRFDNQVENRFLDNHDMSEGFVTYESQIPYNYLRNKQEGIRHLFAIKNPRWKYEHEYRMFWLKPGGVYKFEKFFITSVYFGLRTTAEEESSLRNICSGNQLNVTFYKAFTKGYAIDFAKV